MTTYDEYYAQCMANNSTQTATINEMSVELTYEQCCEACANWAKMKVEQDSSPNNNNE